MKKLKNIINILAKDNPDPQTELNYINEFTLLVAIILSAQTTDKMVNRVTEDLFNVAKSPEKMLNLGDTILKKYIGKVNYANSKVRNILNTCAILIKKYNSTIPSTFEELIDLPGVGRKTANVFLNIAHHKNTIAVDTHVFRITNRIFGKQFIKPEQTEEFLIKINKHEKAKDTHHFLILHGRYTCKSRKPLCEICKISQHCNSFNKNVK